MPAVIEPDELQTSTCPDLTEILRMSRELFPGPISVEAMSDPDSPGECLRYTLSMPVHVAVCGAGTQGQMEDNIRTAQSFNFSF